MTQLQVAVAVAGVILGLVGLHYFSRWLRKAPLDMQSSQRLIEIVEVEPELPPPPSLSRTTQLVDDGLSSPMAAQRFLVPLLTRVEASRPGPNRPLPPLGNDPRRWLAEALDLLEEE